MRITLPAIGILLAFTLNVKAQAISLVSKDSTQVLRQVTVVYLASKLTPVTFQEIKRQQLAIKNISQEPSFLLAETPSVTAYSDAGNTQGYSYYRIRGIDQTRINVTLDGMPLNEPEDQGAYFSNYPDLFSSVSSVQIQRGVGTTKNGNASYGGSLQLSSPDLSEPAKLSLSTGYGSFNTFRATGEYNSGVKENKALYVRASHLYSDGYKYRSANNSQSVFISSALYQKDMHWRLNVMAGNQRNQLAWLGVSETQLEEDPRTNANSAEDDRFTQALLQLQNSWIVSERSSLNSSIYYTFLNGNYDFDYQNFLGQPSTEELYNYALRSNFVGLFSNYNYTHENLSWTSGLHANNYRRRHTGSERSIGELYQNTGFKKELSLYSKLEYSLLRFLLFADLQYRTAHFDYSGSTPFGKLNWQFLNPKAGLSYTLNQEAVVYYSIGMTGREPTRNDIFGGEDDLAADDSGAPILANTTPEYVLDQEMGIRYSTGKLQADANLFYMDFRNEIVLDGNFGPNGLALTNKVDKSLRAGAELNLRYAFTQRLSTTHSASYTYSRIKEQDITFSPILTPPVILNQTITYRLSPVTLGLSARYQSSSYMDFANTAKLNGYLLLNASAQYTSKDWELSVFLNNLTNTRYFNYGYVDYDGTSKYFLQAPTNLFVSVKRNF